MSFRRVSIIGTLAAVALALLVILPVFARSGVDIARTDATNSLQVQVGNLADNGDFVQKDTRLGAILYVSNDTTMRDGTPADAADSVIIPSEITPNAYSVLEITVARNGTPAEETAANYLTRFPDDMPAREAAAAAARNSVIDVRSDSGRSPTVVVTVSDDNLLGRVYVIPPVSSGTAPNGEDVAVVDGSNVSEASTIEASDEDTITVTAIGNTIRLTVDGEGPAITDITPRDGTLQSSSNVNVGFTVTDSGSGLRTDREDPSEDISTDGPDMDGVLGEPLSDGILGASADIHMSWNASTNEERRGDRSWIEVERDHSYSTTFSIAGLTSDTYEWDIMATDRVGNESQTDSDGSESGKQRFELTVDNQSPEAAEIFAGIGFDVEDGEEVSDSSSILVIFENEGVGGRDNLDSSTIDASDFRVEGNEVVDVIHPNERRRLDKKDTEPDDVITDHQTMDDDGDGDVDDITYDYDDPTTTDVDENVTQVLDPIIRRGSAALDDDKCNSHSGFSGTTGQAIPATTDPTACIDTRNRIYLVLTTPLGDDEAPEIQILGGALRDRAGNGNVALAGRDADDRIAPTLTVGVTGDVTADGRPLAQEEITVTVASGERLQAAPSIWLVSFDQDGKIADDGVDSEIGSPDGANAWDASFDGPDEDTMVAAIIIRATDRFGNTFTTTGWKDDPSGPDDGDSLNLVKLDAAGLIVEFDEAIAFDDETDITLNPSSEDEPLKTESVFPFIELRFTEGKENTVSYTVGEDEDKETKTANSYTDDDGEETKFDSYGRVEISDVTLNGENVDDIVVRVSSAGFDIALSNLSVGDHTLEFTVTDTAGNSTTEEVDFEVLPRSAYEVDLRPGWNLVSFPGDPVDTAIDSVLPADHPAIEVLKYDAGLWVAAVRDAGQPWEGELTDIDGQSAYWINTTSTKSLEAVLIQPGVGSASRPPAIPLIAGWNLIPVTDLDQEEAGTAQADYFSSLSGEDFVVAYSYDAVSRKWTRLTMDGNVENGQGVWVYSRSNVVLVP